MAKKSETTQTIKDIKPLIAIKKGDRYFEGVGRRKTAVARVRITKGTGTFAVNGKKPDEYFNTLLSGQLASSPLEKLALEGKFNVSAKVVVGGVNAQAEAVRLGLSRALVIFEAPLRDKLRAFGFLTRDPRMVERKKYGHKKARRSPQWKKR